MKRFFTFFLLFAFTIYQGSAQSISTIEKKKLTGREGVSQLKVPLDILKKQAYTPEGSAIDPKAAPAAEIMKVDKIKSGYGLKSASGTASLDSVLFMRPDGFFMPGLSSDFSSYFYYFLFGPAHSNNSFWRNLSGGATNYSWTLPDPAGSTQDNNGFITSTITSTEENPAAYYPRNSFFSTPSLIGSDGSASETYVWGAVDSTYLIAGGSLLNSLDVGACNYDSHYEIISYYSSVNEQNEYSYMYGTKTDGSLDAVMNYFEKPAQKYVLDSLWIYAGFCSAPAGTEFNIVIHRIKDGELADTIATASTTIEEVAGPFYNDFGYTLSFSNFNVYDEDLGFDIKQDYLEIEDAIMVELNGFNTEGVTLSIMSQELNTSPTGENNAYLYYYSDNIRNFGSYTGVYTSLAFNMDITYSYLFASDSVFNASTSGDSKTFNMTTYFSPTTMWADSIDNDWLSLTYDFDQETWAFDVTFTAAALPDDISGRADTVTLYTYGSDFTFYITQGDVTTGIDDVVQKDEFKIMNNNGTLHVTYPGTYAALEMYDISGRKTGTYQLSSSGAFSFIPEVSVKKGYLYSEILRGKRYP